MVFWSISWALRIPTFHYGSSTNHPLTYAPPPCRNKSWLRADLIIGFPYIKPYQTNPHLNFISGGFSVFPGHEKPTWTPGHKESPYFLRGVLTSGWLGGPGSTPDRGFVPRHRFAHWCAMSLACARSELTKGKNCWQKQGEKLLKKGGFLGDYLWMKLRILFGILHWKHVRIVN